VSHACASSKLRHAAVGHEEREHRSDAAHTAELAQARPEARTSLLEHLVDRVVAQAAQHRGLRPSRAIADSVPAW